MADEDSTPGVEGEVAASDDQSKTQAPPGTPEGSSGATDGEPGDGGRPEGSSGDGGTGDEGGQPPVESKWPDQWREEMAGDDAKLLKRLQRFQSPADVVKWGRELEKKLSSGEYKKGLPDDASEEDIAAWRKEQGIPEKPEGYYEALGDLKIGDSDKPIFDDFFETVALPQNMSPESAKATADWYYALQQARADEQAETDNTSRQEAEDALREEWGKDYRTNLNMISNLMSRAPDEVRDNIYNARDPEGKALFNNPAFMQFLAGIERTMNPSGTVVPSDGQAEKAMNNRIEELQDMMRKQPSKWYSEEKYRKELESLYESRTKLQAMS